MLNFIGNITTVILTPITTAITSVMGATATSALLKVDALLNYLKQFVPFAISYLGLSSEVLAIIISLFGALILVPIGVHAIKLAIKWYNALKI